MALAMGAAGKHEKRERVRIHHRVSPGIIILAKEFIVLVDMAKFPLENSWKNKDMGTLEGTFTPCQSSLGHGLAAKRRGHCPEAVLVQKGIQTPVVAVARELPVLRRACFLS